MANHTPKIILNSTYRASDRNREWRVIRAGDQLTVESESSRNALNEITWRREEGFCYCSAAMSILEKLVELAKL